MTKKWKCRYLKVFDYISLLFIIIFIQDNLKQKMSTGSRRMSSAATLWSGEKCPSSSFPSMAADQPLLFLSRLLHSYTISHNIFIDEKWSIIAADLHRQKTRGDSQLSHGASSLNPPPPPTCLSAAEGDRSDSENTENSNQLSPEW